MFYIQHRNAFWGKIQDDKTLRTELKTLNIDARRMSRFSQLVLLGALPLRDILSPDTPIFLGSPFTSPSKFNKMFLQLTEQNFPSPLDFMANLNNSATFLLAQQFQTTAPSLSLAIESCSFWQPLQLALLELETHKQVLVGWAFEHFAENQSEGSLWWLISKEERGKCLTLDKLKQNMANTDDSFLQRLENLIGLV